MPKSKYDNKECTVGEQLFLSNPSQSNDNLIDSTAGSCDPLFANQSFEKINLGKCVCMCFDRFALNNWKNFKNIIFISQTKIVLQPIQ